MNIRSFVFAFSAMFLVIAPAMSMEFSAPNESEKFTLPIPEGWEIYKKQEGQRFSIIEMSPAGVAFTEASQQFSVQIYYGFPVPIQHLFSIFHKNLKKVCPASKRTEPAYGKINGYLSGQFLFICGKEKNSDMGAFTYVNVLKSRRNMYVRYFTSRVPSFDVETNPVTVADYPKWQAMMPPSMLCDTVDTAHTC